MRIKCLELQNFRKLKSVRIDFDDETTLFVGANNSGKTSAMAALRRFLTESRDFAANDFTLSNWSPLNKIGTEWEKPREEGVVPAGLELKDWQPFLPSLDVWLSVGPTELHHVSNLLPTLDWTGGNLGVRLLYEPKDITELFKLYSAASKEAVKAIEEAKRQKAPGFTYKVALWPKNLQEFISRKLDSLFTIRAYLLDPANLIDPDEQGMAKPQVLPTNAIPLEGKPFDRLIRIDEINAQRGFGETNWTKENQDGDQSRTNSDKKKLSEQLRTYYARHIDPAESPDATDIDALEAICEAQSAFDKRLVSGFEDAFTEVQGLGYPGFSDPKLILSTKLHPIDGLKHSSALQYEIICQSATATEMQPRLPEHYNGLGYQNLISMVFLLMSFRDDWMQKGKARKKAELKGEEEFSPPPLHLVLIEEPEAHLHVQVQQVFIRKAYKILRNHADLVNGTNFGTQLVVSTHSSHIAHECDFSTLRYFRRRPAIAVGDVPTSTVINLTEVFGSRDETQQFVTRYLRATHCDLFFADAAILLEGPAERMLVPHFIRKKYPKLHEAYITLLEIGGSHAHTLRPLIEKLQLITLVITDLDSSLGTASARPARGATQVTRNATLKGWVPAKTAIDDLLALTAGDKEKRANDFFAVRAAYQIPCQVSHPAPTPPNPAPAPTEGLPYTFEDSLVYHNMNVFRSTGGIGLLKGLRNDVATSTDVPTLGQAMFDRLSGTSGKAAFALDLLALAELEELAVPNYIDEGLVWLQQQLIEKLKDRFEVIAAASTGTAAVPPAGGAPAALTETPPTPAVNEAVPAVVPVESPAAVPRAARKKGNS